MMRYVHTFLCGVSHPCWFNLQGSLLSPGGWTGGSETGWHESNLMTYEVSCHQVDGLVYLVIEEVLHESEAFPMTYEEVSYLFLHQV